MCNLYAVTKGQQAIRDLTRAMADRTGNLPPLPGIYPDYPAPSSVTRQTAANSQMAACHRSCGRYPGSRRWRLADCNAVRAAPTFLTRLYADAGYQGPRFANAVKKAMGQMQVEIVKRSELHRFVVLPKRWLVERTIAWLNRCRRLAKDWENHSRNALAFLRLASIRFMLRKLCNPA